MPKASLEFQLPEERNEFTLAIRGPVYHSVLWDFDQALRKMRKYGNLEGDAERVLESVNMAWTEALDGVDLEEVG